MSKKAKYFTETTIYAGAIQQTGASSQLPAKNTDAVQHSLVRTMLFKIPSYRRSLAQHHGTEAEI